MNSKVIGNRIYFYINGNVVRHQDYNKYLEEKKYHLEMEKKLENKLLWKE